MSGNTSVQREQSHFSAEFRLLLQCANQHPDARETEQLRAAASRDIDWVEFTRLTGRHRVVPHAYLALNHSAQDLVPESAMQDLAGHFDSNVRRSLLMGGELFRICQVMNDAEVPLMCLKGPALALQMYGGLERRQFRDLDLLVPPQHLVPAARLLNALGYHEVESAPLTSLRPRQLNRLLKYQKHAVMIDPNRPAVCVELHWQVGYARQFSISDRRLWHDGHQQWLCEGSFHVLPPEELIVFLAWHGGTHRWKRLSWLFDLAQALRSVDDCDEAALFETAAELGVKKYLALGMALVRTLIDNDQSTPIASCPAVRRELESSCRAMLADTVSSDEEGLVWTLWNSRMAGASGLRLLLSRVMAPRMNHLHCNGLLAYVKRVYDLQRRAIQLVLSRVWRYHARHRREGKRPSDSLDS